MNAAAVLSLIGDLYGQIVTLRQREQELLARIQELEPKGGPGVGISPDN